MQGMRRNYLRQIQLLHELRSTKRFYKKRLLTDDMQTERGLQKYEHYKL